MESLLADESLSESSTEDSNQGNEEERLENRNLRANVKNEHDTLRNQQHNTNESRGRIDAPFYVSGIQVPQSCSLCTFNKIKFSIETTNRGVNLDSTYFTYAPHLNPKDPNGLWLKFSTQTAFGKDILLLIELYERNASSGPSPNDAKVQFCRGKCGTKKSEIVSLNETKLVRENGAFEATVAINEQCAHRSKNGYGSPDTLFYFRMQLGEVKNNQFVPFSQFNSTLIKVVAPGKNKGPHPPASVPAKTKVPTVGMKTVTQKKNKAPKIQISQLIESMGMTIQQLTDRVVALENRVNLQDHLLQSVGLNASHLKGEMIPISQNCKMEPYHHPVSSPQYCNPDANSKDHGEPSSCAYAGLRQSGEFSYDSFLNLSTDNSMFNLMRSD